MKKSLYVFIFILAFHCVQAQEVIKLSLQEAIELAQTGSIASRQINNNFRSSFWQYRAYKARRLPNVGLTGDLPDFNRSINAQLLPDGTQDFISTNVFNSRLGLNVSQPIALTGGEVFINSGIQRIDNLDADIEIPTSYFTNPVSIGFRQSIFGFNNFRWEKKTAPLLYEEASREKIEELERLAIDVVRVYFNYLLSQENLKIATNNFASNEKLYQIAQGRFELGKIAENDLLQMELSVLQASNNLESSKIDLQRSKNNLLVLLSLDSGKELDLALPSSVPKFKVNPDQAYQEAKANRKDIVSFMRRRIEADQEVARTKAEQKLQLNLFGSFGVNKTAVDFENAYNDPLDQQERFNLGLAIPIYDGGERKSAYRIAKSNQEVVYADLEQQELAFEREVRLKALEVGVLQSQLIISAKSDSIAKKRYEITEQRYLIGKIDITELNLALNSKDQSRRSYISALLAYWEAYFRIRELTLFDFQTQTRLYQPNKVE